MGESEQEITSGGGSEYEQPELLRVRMWQIRPVRWTGTTETGHGGHEEDYLLHPKSNEKSVKSFNQAEDMIKFAFLKVTQWLETLCQKLL